MHIEDHSFIFVFLFNYYFWDGKLSEEVNQRSGKNWEFMWMLE